MTNGQEKRKYCRHDISSAVVITQKGACQVFNISPEGISFKCLYYHELPDEWVIDIIDSTGFHIQECTVQKVWETRDQSAGSRSIFTQEIGARFKNLTQEQQEILNEMIDNLDEDSSS